MRRIVDFHIHSKYSRATSKNLDLHEIAKWSKIKGLDIVSCADFTHPRWFEHIKKTLQEDGSGLLSHSEYPGVQFMLTTEVACIYRHNDATRRLHHVLLSPSIESVSKINELLTKYGAKLASDGRPILGMSSKDLLKIVKEADEKNELIPAHVWTPWFALFGSKSGYDSVEECFEELTPYIFALETGLSSDPEMNWALSQLDDYVLVSNSDAHSGPKLGREANVFNMKEDSYEEIIDILKTKDKKRFLYTIEFFPEEGMYHYDGHRACGVRFTPEQTKKAKSACPQCKKSLTVGVMHRVDNLRDRKFGETHKNAIPFKKIIPLPDILADYVQTKSTTSVKVKKYFDAIIQHGSNEFRVLLDMDEAELKKIMPKELADGIIRIRKGDVSLTPGYDGVYGTVSVFSELQRKSAAQQVLL